MQSVTGNLVEIASRVVRPVQITFNEVGIRSVDPIGGDPSGLPYLLPGFIDSHVHVESSMLTPSQFAAVAVTHGTIATVSDPHEIANVLGTRGVQYMLDDAKRVPFKFCFGAPSCVPATSFETAGSTLDVDDTKTFLEHPDIHYLAEMMNYPGVLRREHDVMTKLGLSKRLGKPIDGHAPGLRGEQAREYFSAGISTDHECFSLDEAVDKLQVGAIIQIREGSAARNFDALWPLIDRYPGRVMFCSDDKHPDDLLHGHINLLCRRAIEKGCDPFHVMTAACLVPARHYGLPVGSLRVGDPADFIEVDSLEHFDVLRNFIDGMCVAEQGKSLINVPPAPVINHFDCSLKSIDDFRVVAHGSGPIRVIVAHDRLLTTSCQVCMPKIVAGNVVADPQQDILKLSVVNRYQDARPTTALVRSFGLRRGAIAGSVAHDSHNVIGVGASDAELCRAVNAVIENRGGLAAVDGDRVETLPLPVAGLMSNLSCREVASQYEKLEAIAKDLGSPLQSPFMTLSFMALLVIPSLKLSDKGLFDGDQFEFVDLFVNDPDVHR